MSNTRYLLGGAAVLGASYYVYQTRLEQSRATAIQQDSLKNKIPGFGSGSSSYDPREGPAEHTGRKIDEKAYDARGRFDDLKNDANKKIDDTFASAEREKAKLANWTNDKISDAQGRLDDTVAHSKEKADVFAKEAHKDDPRGLRKVGNEIRDTAEDAKDSVFGTLGSAKNSIIGSKNKAEDSVYGTYDSAKSNANDLTKQAQDKADEASNKTSSWFGGAKKDAEETLDSASQKTEDTKKSFFSWGSSKKDEAKETIDAAYDEAQKIYDDADKRYKETKGSWFSWNRDSKKQQLHDEAEKQLNEAQKNLESASSKAKNKVNDYIPTSSGGSSFFGRSKPADDSDKANEFFTGELINRKEGSKSKFNTDRNYDRANEFFTGELINRSDGPKSNSGSFYDWLRGGYPSPTEDEKIASGARQGLRGWGESAEQFSREEYEDAKKAASINNKSSSSSSSSSWGLPTWLGGSSSKSSQPGNKLQPDDERIARGARQGLRGWGENAAQFADEEVEEAKGLSSKANDKYQEKKSSSNGLGSWFGTSKNDEQIAKDAKQGLKGWGESASQFANDEADEAKRQASKYQKEYDSKLKEWNSWGNKKYEENAKGAQEYFNDAQKQFETVQKDINENAKHWWSWGSAKGEELESQAKKNLQDAELRLGDATNNLKKWTNDSAESANIKFWSSADDAVHQAKKGISTANEKGQEGLNDASSWINKEKK